jgi:chemotaxis protein CheZ
MPMATKQSTQTKIDNELSLEDMKDILGKLEQIQFFESLTKEFAEKIKNIAKEMIIFKEDLQRKLEPGIVAMAQEDIPEASNQLEGINETLEKSTMRIMDINDEQMELANTQLELLETLLSENGNNKSEVIKEQADVLKRIGELSYTMLEPLSFQDLVGQRIQRIIELVKSMESHIEDLVISCGIKIQKHKEDPSKTYEDLEKDVKDYRSELKGPQRESEGLNQEDIDALLVTL